MNGGYMACQGSCFDIGNTMREALRRFSRTEVSYAGTDNPFASGNGGIMRLAPAVIAAGDRATAVEYAINSSRTTHVSGDCLGAAELLGAILWKLHEVTDLKDLLEDLPDTNERDMAIGRIKRGRYFERNAISSSGYVIDTLEAAFGSSYHPDCFEEALIMAVNLGDDADTVGAVTGQIAGAAWGVDAIPTRWLEKLVWRERVESMAVALASQGIGRATHL